MGAMTKVPNDAAVKAPWRAPRLRRFPLTRDVLEAIEKDRRPA